jgi:hypothetical protein
MRNWNGIAIALEFLVDGAGFYAAYCWLKASTGKIEPTWKIEPGESELAEAGWIAGIMNSVVESADLNRKAAWWTGLAVLLSVVSNVVNFLASYFH